MAAILGPSYSIASPTGRCAATGRPLGPGEPLVAVLVERPGREELTRADYSPEAWEAGARPGPPEAVFASWRAVMPEPGRPRGPVIDQDAVVDLFEQLAESGEARRVTCRYMLALMLLRKRVLRLVEERRDPSGGATLLVRWGSAARSAEPLMEVIDPGLGEDDIAAAAAELRALTGEDAA